MINLSSHSLVLMVCNYDMTNNNGIKIPIEGVIECISYENNIKSSNGLQGWLYGHGYCNINSYFDIDYTKWLVVSVETSTIIKIDGKVKFKNGVVIFCGTQKDATDFLMKNEPRSLLQPIIGAFVSVGDNKTASTSYIGTSNSGLGGKSISSDRGISVSGDYGLSISGRYGTSISYNFGTSISGDKGTSTSYDYGTSISGYCGTSISGYKGTSTSGEYGNVKQA